jgi:hypothetical protein
MNKAVRTCLVTASLLASFAGLVASPATGEDPARPADLSLAAPSTLDLPASSPLLQRLTTLAQAPASGDKRGHHHRPPPPPTLATFTGVVAIGRTRYRYTLVGTNPQLRRAQNVVVPVAVIPLSMEFSDGTVLDTSQPDTCLGGLSALTAAMQSPLFQDFDYGEGPRQFLEQIRRLEFWQFTGPGKLNPGYSVRLSPTVLPTQTLALSPTSFTEQVACLSTGGSQIMGHVDIRDFNNFLLSQVVPQFPQWGVNASNFVLILLPYIDFHIPGDPYIVAYHGAFYPPQGGVVTYAAAQLGAGGPGLVNIGALSHEFAEWLDDPYGDNDTPPWYWGNTGGQVTGCGEGLEVGDPMIGTFLPPVQMPNGISYQAQETAFFSWFFQQVPSLGFDGWYSSGGTFKSPAPICH